MPQWLRIRELIQASRGCVCVTHVSLPTRVILPAFRIPPVIRNKSGGCIFSPIEPFASMVGRIEMQLHNCDCHRRDAADAASQRKFAAFVLIDRFKRNFSHFLRAFRSQLSFVNERRWYCRAVGAPSQAVRMPEGNGYRTLCT